MANKKVSFACPACLEICKCTLVYGEVFDNPKHPCLQCDECGTYFTIVLTRFELPPEARDDE